MTGTVHQFAPPPSNDPLAGLTAKQLWHDLVWFSDETTHMKIFLLCIGRFFDDEGRASSMALSQVIRECGFSEDTARRCAKRARNFWLQVEVQKGHLTRYGRQNLYHAVMPPAVLDGLRRYRGQQQAFARMQAQRAGLQGGGSQHSPRGGLTAPPNSDIYAEVRVVDQGKAGNSSYRSPSTRGVQQAAPYRHPLDGGWQS